MDSLLHLKVTSGQISGDLSKEVIFRLRKMLHSILVTPGTVLNDRPKLTPRYGSLSLKDKLADDFLSRALRSFDFEYPHEFRGIQKRFIMIPDFSPMWNSEDLKKYVQMQTNLPGKSFYILNNKKTYYDLEQSGFDVYFQSDFSNLWQTLEYINSKGTLNLMIEAGPVFSEIFD